MIAEVIIQSNVKNLNRIFDYKIPSEYEENAIELYSFAKENQFKILQDKTSKMLKIYLKLERYSSEEILSHRGGILN